MSALKQIDYLSKKHYLNVFDQFYVKSELSIAKRGSGYFLLKHSTKKCAS